MTIFGVFDGHGGSEVALYVEKKFVSTLINLKSYKEKNYEKALFETFLAMDEQIIFKEGIE